MPTPAGERVASHLPEIHLPAMTRVHTAMRFPPALHSVQMLAVVGWCAAGGALAKGGLTAAWVWWLGLAALATIGRLQTSLGIGSGAAVVREARDGDRLERGVVLIAPGGLAQDEASCVVFGMPKEGIKLGAVDQVLLLDRRAGAILQFDARG